jgi:pimeloyl-ACP methyl ester carboxylesterase
MTCVALVFATILRLAPAATAADAPVMVCSGTRAAGAPVVVLEAGAGNGAETWAKVQPPIAEFTRVCAYDRPALRRHWKNGEPPAAPTPAAVIDTLDGALSQAGEHPPYILVGHSYGGLIVRLYATRFPDRVKGLVLVDSSHEDQTRRFAALDPSAAPPPPAPAAARPEILDFEAVSAELRAQPWRANIPLLVLTRGNAGAANPATPPDAGALARYEVWVALHDELATRSPLADHVIARHSGHYIHNDEPRLVIDGIRRIVAATQR